MVYRDNTDYPSMRSNVIVREIRNVILSEKEAFTLICMEVKNPYGTEQLETLFRAEAGRGV